MTSVVLLQNDLRMQDNPALFHAAKKAQPIVVIYVKPTKMGGASLWWLSKSLPVFDKDLSKHGLSLLYFDGQVEDLLKHFDDQIDEIFANNLDQDIPWPKDKVHMFYPNLLFYPHHLQKQFKIFTPFWKYCQAHYPTPENPLSTPYFQAYHRPETLPKKLSVYPKLSGPQWWDDMERFWEVGEVAAHKRLEQFKNKHLHTYDKDRNFPALDHTSFLSPYLHFGQISVRHIWHELKTLPPCADSVRFLAELGWREFAYHLQIFNPAMSEKPMRSIFNYFPWGYNEEFLKKWQQGMTGYPIVDAGMRQLWHTGWMHNRVRMIVGSFLTKNLLLSWQEGAEWFFDTLVDADGAVNAMNWQWVAGCGTDSAPYFRIFNPILQGQKFDPAGDYVRTWVKELQGVDAKFIHEPWLDSGFKSSYPLPIVDLKRSRQKALEAFGLMKAL